MGTSGGKIPAGQPYAGRTCLSTCNIASPGTNTPTCAYIDPPSIQSNEYLPFRWDLEATKNTNLNYTNACSATSVGKILQSSVKCEFTVTDAKGDTVTSFTANCFDPVAASETLVKSAFTQTMKDLGYASNEFLTPVGYEARKFNFTNLGEHKISLKVAKYDECGAFAS